MTKEKEAIEMSMNYYSTYLESEGCDCIILIGADTKKNKIHVHLNGYREDMVKALEDVTEKIKSKRYEKQGR